jgi:hypothetical protein
VGTARWLAAWPSAGHHPRSLTCSAVKPPKWLGYDIRLGPRNAAAMTVSRASCQKGRLRRGGLRMTVAFNRVSRVTDEPLEPVKELVARRIREQLVEGRLSELLDATFQQASAQLQVRVQLEAAGEVTATDVVGITDSATFELTHDLAIEAASPELAHDLQGRSPQDINLAINIFIAIMQLLQALLTVYQIVHGEPPSQQQVVQIFNQTTNVVVNMPPPGHDG